MLGLIRIAISKIANYRTWGDLITEYEKRSILSAAIVSELKIKNDELCSGKAHELVASAGTLIVDEIDGPCIDMKLIKELSENYPDIGFLGFRREFECLARFNICKYHAIIHDACGTSRSKYGVGPGYRYASNCSRCMGEAHALRSSCPLIGHITGLIWC